MHLLHVNYINSLDIDNEIINKIRNTFCEQMVLDYTYCNHLLSVDIVKNVNALHPILNPNSTIYRPIYNYIHGISKETNENNDENDNENNENDKKNEENINENNDENDNKNNENDKKNEENINENDENNENDVKNQENNDENDNKNNENDNNNDKTNDNTDN